MEKPFVESIEKIHNTLDLFSHSTGDCYFIYEFSSNKVYLSENILEKDDIFPIDTCTFTLSEWHHCVDSRDTQKLTRIMNNLICGKINNYSINYRVKNKSGQSNWINSRGKVFYNHDGQPLYVLGRLSSSDPSRQPGSFSTKDLKKETRKILSSLQPGYLLLIGVDNLKTINLKNGRDFGDAVLCDVAQVICDEAQHKHRVYRINGDWFAANFPSYTDKEISQLFDNIQERLSGQCTVSGGCVSYTDYHVSDESTLLQYAEISLDYSKTHGKNTLTFFSPESYEKKLRELELREDLQKSVSENFEGFELYYQGQFHSETYTLYGAEALLRYTSPRHGSVSPSEFVPILEQSNLIYPVRLWVASEALKTCRQWRKYLPQFHISINMSYRQLEQDCIRDDLPQLVKNAGLPGNALTVEVTESMELSNYTQLNDYFRHWKKHGIEISVDDFGTGYSSLGRLKEMAVDEIKIDRCFVREIQNSAYNLRLLSNIIELADSSQIRVCCEGVETEDELKVLDELHPALLQGFLFAKPCNAADFEAHFLSKENCAETQYFRTETLPAPISSSSSCESPDEIAQTILSAENDIFYLCDLSTYELYYLNPAGQKIFGVKDYCGKKCYKVLHGKDAPCSFCTNRYLRQDSFYIWENKNEYCGRHFLLKDKIVIYKGKKVRLEVALDITKQEYVSQSAKERLAFAEKIVGYMNALSAHSDYDSAVNHVLASVGDFYQADRAYLFEPSPNHEGYWNNTFEWCAPRVSPQRDNLQNVSPFAVKRWMNLFSEEKSIIVFNLAPLKESSPEEWKVLHAQGIQRLIAVPLRNNGKTIGFIGVDNPRNSIHDDSQIRVLASFLLARIRQDQNEHRYQALLQESNHDLLNALHVGFWTLTIDKTTGVRELFPNETMKELLGLADHSTPREQYQKWVSRIESSCRDSVCKAFQKMIRGEQVVQFIYRWQLSLEQSITLRFSGILMEDTASSLKLKGYCRQMPDSMSAL